MHERDSGLFGGQTYEAMVQALCCAVYADAELFTLRAVDEKTSPAGRV
jgi:hypothetical protein